MVGSTISKECGHELGTFVITASSASNCMTTYGATIDDKVNIVIIARFHHIFFENEWIGTFMSLLQNSRDNLYSICMK